jgi:hypothetical protein
MPTGICSLISSGNFAIYFGSYVRPLESHIVDTELARLETPLAVDASRRN